MALIKLKVDTSGPAPQVVSDDVLAFNAGDRLLFVADNGKPVLVELGDETGRMVALVKFKGGGPGDFAVAQLPAPDGRVIVKLQTPGGEAPDPDPPD